MHFYQILPIESSFQWITLVRLVKRICTSFQQICEKKIAVIFSVSLQVQSIFFHNQSATLQLFKQTKNDLNFFWKMKLKVTKSVE